MKELVAFSILPGGEERREVWLKCSLDYKNEKEIKVMNGILILLVYAVIMIGITILFARNGTGKDDFYVGNRNMGTLSSAMSIAATWIWAPALFTSAQQAYTNGIPGLFWFLVPNVLCLMLFIPFARKIRDRMPEGITLSGFMGKEYKSEGVKKMYGLQLGLLTILSTAVQLLAGGKILASATGINFGITTVILAVIAYSYARISGIRASVMTDAIQMIFLLAACAIFVPWALRMPGGITNLCNGLGGLSGNWHLFDGNGIAVLLSFGLPTAIGLISGPFGDQCFWQRAFSINEKKIGRSFFTGALMFGIVPLSMGILGFIAAGSGYEAVDKSIVNFEVIIKLFPSWVQVPFLFMLISGLLSTVDSNLCAIASLTTDWKVTSKLENTEKTKFSRYAMVLLLLISILIANIPGLTVTHMFLIYGTLRATTLLPTVFTLCRVKLNAKGVIAGISTAMLTGLPIFAYATLNNIAMLKTVASLYTVLSAGIIAVMVSRIGGHYAEGAR